MGNNIVVPFSFPFYISEHVDGGGHITNGSEVKMDRVVIRKLR